MENSHIEWTHHTFNPWIGCTKVSPGCLNCPPYNSDLAKTARWAVIGMSALFILFRTTLKL